MEKINTKYIRGLLLDKQDVFFKEQVENNLLEIGYIFLIGDHSSNEATIEFYILKNSEKIEQHSNLEVIIREYNKIKSELEIRVLDSIEGDFLARFNTKKEVIDFITNIEINKSVQSYNGVSVGDTVKHSNDNVYIINEILLNHIFEGVFYGNVVMGSAGEWDQLDLIKNKNYKTNEVNKEFKLQP